MRRNARIVRLSAVVTVMVCMVAATAASAMATVSIEPLNTKFTGKAAISTEWELNPNLFLACSSSTSAGTTNSTKTNYVNLTPAFSGCTYVIGTVKRTATLSNSCKTEGTVPWTLTFNGAAGKGNASLKLNCALLIKMGACTVTAAEQTTGEKAMSWKNVGTTKLEVTSNSNTTILAATVNSACKEGILELGNGPIGLSAVSDLEGIYAN
jgi:hypothetical protein